MVEDDLPNDDAICCALAANRSVEVIYRILQHYLPTYEKLPGDYAVWGLPDEVTFPDEDTMLRYCVADATLAGSFFWNQERDNPRRIMVGAVLTKDGHLVMSLTMQATRTNQVEERYLAELQEMIGADCGVIYGNIFPEFEDGADFRRRYAN